MKVPINLIFTKINLTTQKTILLNVSIFSGTSCTSQKCRPLNKDFINLAVKHEPGKLKIEDWGVSRAKHLKNTSLFVPICVLNHCCPVKIGRFFAPL